MSSLLIQKQPVISFNTQIMKWKGSGTNFSDNATKAVNYAVQIAKMAETELIIFMPWNQQTEKEKKWCQKN